MNKSNEQKDAGLPIEHEELSPDILNHKGQKQRDRIAP